MSAIIAVLSRSDAPVTTATLETMLAACPERAIDGQDIWANARVGLGHQHFWLLPEEQGERQPHVDISGEYVITADARLDNREELATRLGIDRTPASAMSDAQLILQAYLRWDAACVDYLLGDFAFVIWDARAGQLFCARDPLGARSIAYYADTQRVIVASDIEAILAHPSVVPQINETKVADFLASLFYYPDDSYYKDIRYCPAGHCLMFGSTTFHARQYWKLEPGAPIRYRRAEEYVEHFDALMVEAVRCRLRTVGPVGISLSGGLDSPSLAAIAAELLPASPARQERLNSFSYVFDELAECDERAFIEPVVARLGLDATFVPSDDKWTLKDLHKWPVDRAMVLSDPYIWLPEGIMVAAEAKSCKLLLAGNYGDSLFTGARFWAVGMLRTGKFGEFIRTMAGHWSEIQWRNHILDAGLRHALPVGMRDAYRRAKPFEEMRWRDCLDSDFAARTDLHARSQDPERPFRSQVGTRTWSRTRSLIINMTTTGLVEVQKYYNRHGLELSNPYLDRRLAEFLLNVPADLLGKPGSNRRLLRSAARKRLPEAITSRTAKTTFESVMEKGVRQENATIRRLMQEPLIVQHGFVRAEWAAAQYFAEETDSWHTADNFEAWLGVCLELWLRRLAGISFANSA